MEQPFFKIASIITKVTWQVAEQEQIRAFVKNLEQDPPQQLQFFEYCRLWKLAPWVHSQLCRQQLIDYFTIETRSLFFELYEKVRSENENRNREALRFLKVFEEQHIEVAILKGNLLAHSVYGDTGYKRMNDFDILVHREDWEKIQDIYFSLGYIPLGFGWSGEKQKAASFSHVGMAFISPDFSCIIGTQWGLKSPTAGYTVNMEEAWGTALDGDFFGVRVKQLSPAYNLLHLMLHMGIYKCGIRDCMDVYNLFLTTLIDEEDLIALLARSGALDKAAFTLCMSNLCSNSLNTLLEKLPVGKDPFIRARLAKRLENFERTGDIHNSYNDYFQDIEKLVIYFNLFPAFHKKLVFYALILKGIFLPNKLMALRLSDAADSESGSETMKARLKAPYFVFSLIAQEIGWSFTFLLFLKLGFDLLFSLKNYFMKHESYFDYLKRRGIDPKAIEKAVKNIQ
ncbi:MAG: nucleotidyltransferase family protein [bacterium]|nr:nucleotidyltransferase family protein [bacterium]